MRKKIVYNTVSPDGKQFALIHECKQCGAGVNEVCRTIGGQIKNTVHPLREFSINTVSLPYECGNPARVLGHVHVCHDCGCDLSCEYVQEALGDWCVADDWYLCSVCGALEAAGLNS